MLRLKKFLKAAVTIAAAVTLAACGASASPAPQQPAAQEPAAPAEKTKIEVWSWWGSEARLPVITHIIDYFNEHSETVEAEYVYTPFGEIFTKNLANIAAGTPADVMFNNMSDVAYRASAGQTENLSPLMDRDSYTADQYQETYMRGLEYEGGYYGLPFIIETRIIYFNKEHFRAIGLDTEDASVFPKTWDELTGLAYKLDVKNGSAFDRVGFLPLFGNGGWYLWLTNADSGKGFWDPGTGDVTIDTPNKLEAVKRIMAMHDHYGDTVVDEMMAATSQGMQNPFGSGAISMVAHNPTFARELGTDFPDLEWGTFLVPEFNEGTGHWSNGDGFVVEIPKGAKNIDASWEFVKYMTSAYAQKYWSTKCFELSALKELANDPELIGDKVYSIALQAAATTDAGFMPNELNGWRDYLNPNLDEVKLRTLPPDDALKKAQSDVEALKARQTQ
ncbi:MAG: extracellular solute-binding protein [Clostridiales bacterium]|jgi:multiple sugar transport system substrate-binding protein|nr:extracellular solute-binding protein [Clostridiales bacterium]